jgi:hypothetical protein
VNCILTRTKPALLLFILTVTALVAWFQVTVSGPAFTGVLLLGAIMAELLLAATEATIGIVQL